MESAWAAGLFEGEGCRTANRGKPRLQLKMVHEESVRRFRDALEVGKVYGPYGPYASQLGQKPYWMWVAEGNDMEAAIRLMTPWLSAWALERLNAAA